MRYCFLALLVAVAACAPREMTADPQSISFAVKTGLVSDNTASAQDRANAHCRRYGKTSTLRSMNQVSVARTVAIFDCVE